VNRMLPDFRFVLGATLAITLLAVAGLGMVTSVRLVREAHIRPIDDSRSLAFAGRAGWNQFYDPDSARRLETSTAEAMVAQARHATPPEIAPVPAPAGTEERTASIAPNRADADIADDKTLATDPPRRPETPAVTAPAPDAPATTVSDPPPADRVANAPTTSPAADVIPEPNAPAPMQPQAVRDPQPDSTIPIPQPRPKVRFRRKIARARIHRPINVASQQTPPNTGFPSTNAFWPSYNNPIADAAATQKGKLTGTPASRSQ
jgi:hypothetical protein